ncbi:MAG: FkbM family methyltransferase [Bacteroidetes bacterium]|nr:FkbM family methyltransferase [Bacteroidota bacterium]
MHQYIFNQLIYKSSLKSYKFKFFYVLRNLIGKYFNPNIVYNLGVYNISIPIVHDLPINIKIHPNYNQNLGKIAKAVNEKYPANSVIDVGANIGDSVAIIHNYVNSPILCIEGNEMYLPLLRKNTSSIHNVSIEASFVGDEEITVKAQSKQGTAFLEESIKDEGIKVKKISAILDKHPTFKNSKLFKTDTDGFDNKILKGAKSFFEEIKPVIFFEYDPYFLSKQNEIGYDIFNFLHNLGYQDLMLFDNTGNYIFTIKSNQELELIELHNYFNQNGSRYLDICAIHEIDKDLIANIKSLL